MTRRNVRVELNRSKLDEIDRAFADALQAMGQRVLEVAQPPDATPFGEGLVTRGDVGTWVDGRKVAGTAAKPRRAKVRPGIVTLVGYGFPGRFQEMGVVHHRAQPFLTPAIDRVRPEAEAIVRDTMRPHSGKR